VNVFGQQIFEKDRLAKTLDARETNTVKTAISIAMTQNFCRFPAADIGRLLNILLVSSA
jgi:hypothetical protein